MTEIRKLVCDVCGREKDLTVIYFGGQDNWQKHKLKDSYAINTLSIKDVCSDDCLMQLLRPNRKNAI